RLGALGAGGVPRFCKPTLEDALAVDDPYLHFSWEEDLGTPGSWSRRQSPVVSYSKAVYDETLSLIEGGQGTGVMHRARPRSETPMGRVLRQIECGTWAGECMIAGRP
ncbi:MAG: hypothetical protein ACE5JI_20020, partial [Acidobacteriota bacterium]